MRTALVLALVVAAAIALGGCQEDVQRAVSRPEPAVDAEVVTAADRELMRALATFARSPTDSTWRRLRLARRVKLGLGRRLIVERAARELRDPAAWMIKVEDLFRARVGPFSALRLLANNRDARRVSVGAHPHCASPPKPPPQQVIALRRVSVQPKNSNSCLSWFSVDAFVGDDGRLRAITLDLWEP
jgi:hypothetical protein